MEPRIAPLAPDEYGPDASQMIDDLLKAQQLPAREDVPEFIATMVRHRALFQAQIDLSTQLFKGALTIRDIELVFLRTSWLCQAPFCFGQHVITAKQVCGFTTEDIERIVEGSGAAGWDEHSRAVLRATEELHETSTISDETWEVLARTLDDKQLIELPMLAGHTHGVAYVQNALKLRLMPGNQGLSAR